MSSILTKAILTGGETALPADTPSGRLNTANEFPFVGALEISDGSATYKGSGVALSPNWVLTAGHNADLNDDGLPDAAWSGTFHLSGYGSYGYTTNASLTDRRSGSNVIDTISLDDEGSGVTEVFRYDFDDPATTGQADGSLGNDIETIIGPGDSGGAALVQTTGGWELVGINTFTEGYGGRFGDTGGGVLVDPYRDWITETTGIPEPGLPVLLLLGLAAAGLRRRRRRPGSPSGGR